MNALATVLLVLLGLLAVGLFVVGFVFAHVLRNRKAMVAMGVVYICIITLSVTLLAQKAFGRAGLDLTANNIYTLSNGTRKVLESLNKPVTLRLYYTREAALKGPEGIRFYNNYYRYVRDLLEEYSRLADGKLELRVIDPRPFSDEEEAAIQAGLKRFMLNDTEFFTFGLVAETSFGKTKVLPFFEPERQEFVEYDVTKLIADAIQRDRKRIGVLSSLPVTGSDMNPYMMQMMRMQGKTPEKPWLLVEQLKESYEVERVDPQADSLPGDLDYLVVIHPKELSERTLFNIDQYVMAGGRLMVFVDPHCFADRAAPNPSNLYASMQHDSSSNLNALLRAWGVETRSMEIAADPALAVTAPMRPNARAEPVLAFLDLDEDGMNDKHVVTADLHDMRVIFAGALEFVEGVEGAALTPLLFTTEQGGVWKVESPAQLQFMQTDQIRKEMESKDKPVILACAIRGKLKSNFPDGIEVETPAEDAPESETGAEKEGEAEPEKKEEKKTVRLEAIAEAQKEALVLVVADVDFITDSMAYRETFFGPAQSGDNASFILNGLDFLGGNTALVEIRSRGKFQRPFTVVEKIERRTEEESAEEVEALQREISDYQSKLRSLGASATEENVKLIEKEALAKRREIETKIRQANKRLRKLQANRREAVDALGMRLQIINCTVAPAAVLLIAIVLAVIRHLKARRYAARRAEG
jgi:ABC-2 type transport system permease protein